MLRLSRRASSGGISRWKSERGLLHDGRKRKCQTIGIENLEALFVPIIGP